MLLNRHTIQKPTLSLVILFLVILIIVEKVEILEENIAMYKLHNDLRAIVAAAAAATAD